jgi:hypothetical protein
METDNNSNFSVDSSPNSSQKDVAQINFEQKLMNYLENNKVCLYILTPCFASLCYVNYVHCLMHTKEILTKYGIEVNIEFCKNDSLVSRARNNLIARAMANPRTTHMIFIDNDITWQPVDILKLILSDKKLVGGVYPLKDYKWKELLPNHPSDNGNVVKSWIDRKDNSQFKNLVSNENLVQNKLLRYNINYLGTHLEIKNNLAKVRHLATGFMMIKRTVIETMAKAFPSAKYTDDVGFLRPEENIYAYALFDCGVEDDHYYSEDWLFCHRWSKLDGSIWIDVTINLTHTGIEDYQGSYLASII